MIGGGDWLGEVVSVSRVAGRHGRGIGHDVLLGSALGAMGGTRHEAVVFAVDRPRGQSRSLEVALEGTAEGAREAARDPGRDPEGSKGITEGGT